MEVGGKNTSKREVKKKYGLPIPEGLGILNKPGIGAVDSENVLTHFLYFFYDVELRVIAERCRDGHMTYRSTSLQGCRRTPSVS